MSGRDAALRSTNFLKAGDAEKLSNAVEPSSTANTARVPGRTGMVGRWSSGLPATTWPVAPLRRNGDSRDATTLYTSNGSARANHVDPNTAAPTAIATA